MKQLKYYLSLIPDYLLIALYVYTASIKLQDLTAFKVKLLKSPLISDEFVDVVKFGVPLVEVLIVLLLISRYKIVGHYISIFLLTVFIIYIYLLNKHSIYNGCGCGGIFESLSLGKHLLINTIFVGLSIYRILSYTDEKQTTSISYQV